MATLLALLLLVGRADVLPIVGDTTCPRPQQVTERLQALSIEHPVNAPARVVLVEDAGAIVVVFENAAGSALDRRRLEALGSCDERAQALALVIGAFLTGLRDAPLEPLVPVSPPPASGPVAARPRVGWEVGAAFVSSLAGSDFAPAARLHVELGRPAGFVAGRMELYGAGERSLTLGYGRASWLRVGVAVGPAFRFRARRARFDLHASVLFAAALVAGHDLPTNLRTQLFSPGLGAGASVGVRVGPVTPFVEVGVAGWPRELTVVSDGPSPASATLPPIEALLSLGIAVGTF